MVQTEAQRRPKAKYYAKMREDTQYKDDMARRQKKYYNNNKEKHLDIIKNIIKLIKINFMNILKRKGHMII